MKFLMFSYQIFVLVLLLFITFSIALPVMAKGLVPCGHPGQSDCTINDLFVMTKGLFDKAVYTYSPLVAISLIVYAGFKMIISRGNPGEITKAKNILTYTVIGLGFIWGAYFIVNLIVHQIFNANL